MEKFALFVKGLMTNHSGIVFAALNLCYFVSKDFVKGLITLNNFDKIMFSLNLPALILSFISDRLIYFLFQPVSWLTRNRLMFAFLLFFVTLQWLFIGWTAKMIARKLGSRGVKE